MSGDPAPSIVWLKDGLPIGANSDYVLERSDDGTCSLVIEETLVEDSAVFTCRAQNAAGLAETSGRLTVTGEGPSSFSFFLSIYSFFLSVCLSIFLSLFPTFFLSSFLSCLLAFFLSFLSFLGFVSREKEARAGTVAGVRNGLTYFVCWVVEAAWVVLKSL